MELNFACILKCLTVEFEKFLGCFCQNVQFPRVLKSYFYSKNMKKIV